MRPRDPTAASHHALGNALHRQGRLDDAIAAYEKAIELNPDYGKAYLNIAEALIGRGRFDDAITVCRKAIERKPDFLEVYVSLGNALSGMGRFDDAIVAYEKGIELTPDFAEAHCNLGNALQLAGRLQAALAARRKGHALGSARPEWRYSSEEWLRASEAAILREARQVVDEEDADTWLHAAASLEALLEGWRADLDNEDREPVVAEWLALLGREPWATLRNPDACTGLPAAEHERWRGIWTEAERLARRSRTKD